MTRACSQKEGRKDDLYTCVCIYVLEISLDRCTMIVIVLVSKYTWWTTPQTQWCEMTTRLFCSWILWIRDSNGHTGDGWSLFQNVCGLSWEGLDDWGLELSGGEGNGNPLQYSCLENPMDGGAWWAAVHGVAKSRTWLSNFTFTFHFHALEKEMATHSSVLACRIPGTVEPGGLLSVGLHWVKHDWSDLAAAAAASHLGRPILYSRTSFIHSVYNTSKWVWCLIEHLDGYWTTPLFIIFLWPYLS